MKSARMLAVLAGLAALTLLFIGCSGDTPLTPNTDQAVTRIEPTDGESAVKLTARVLVTDENRRMLVLAGEPDTVVALQNCQITRFSNDNDTPIPFDGIHPGDTVNVEGTKNQNGYIYAHKLRVCEDGCDGLCYDIAFRDTIVEIDYELGTFTVKNRAELITTDENTVIRGTVSHWCPDPSKEQTKNKSGTTNATCEQTQLKLMRHDTLMAFTDLAAGDIVEVRAFVVDENTLLAAKIHLAECDAVEKKCVEFADYIETIDSETGLVSFQDTDWFGTVCNGASLKDLDGNPIELSDFAVGDYVAVKGFPLEDGSLRICQMILSTP